jgi:hypothetical protein
MVQHRTVAHPEDVYIWWVVVGHQLLNERWDGALELINSLRSAQETLQILMCSRLQSDTASHTKAAISRRHAAWLVKQLPACVLCSAVQCCASHHASLLTETSGHARYGVTELHVLSPTTSVCSQYACSSTWPCI